jgi:DMSO/TMAO reductase YedYZ heme-binding membrane subunit
MQAEMIPKILDVALLQGPPPMKIGVVEFCMVPLVATSQKIRVVPLPATKKWKIIQKTLVTKVVGLVNMHISPKNGIMIRKFSMELAHTMV